MSYKNTRANFYQGLSPEQKSCWACVLKGTTASLPVEAKLSAGELCQHLLTTKPALPAVITQVDAWTAVKVYRATSTKLASVLPRLHVELR